MRPIIHHKQQIAGLSLIELMVALAVSSIMLLGVTTVYKASKRSYQINSEMAEIQENARFALHNLTKEIRMAGYTGCMNIDKLQLNVISSGGVPGFDVDPNQGALGISAFNVNTYITGHTDNGGTFTPAFEPGLSPVGLADAPIEPGTDAITIRSLSACSSTVVRETANKKGLEVEGNCDYKAGDVVVVTNCGEADMFTISDVGGTVQTPILNHDKTVNDPELTKTSYSIGTVVHKVNAVVFYVGQDNIANPPAKGLYVRRLVNQGGVLAPQSSLLIPNVENMVITYGLDTDGDRTRSVDTVLPAITIGNDASIVQAAYQKEVLNGTADDTVILTSPWSRVIRVNMQLLFASDPIGTTLKPFNFNGKNYNDTRTRRVFSTAINIRARTP